ncbi:hypothetical protein [Thermovibrio sp.]
MRSSLLLFLLLLALPFINASAPSSELKLSNPSPLGLEIGSTSFAEVRARFGCKFTSFNERTGGTVCLLEKIKLPEVRQAEAFFDKNDLLVGVKLLFPKLQGDEEFYKLLWVLGRKYRPLRVELPAGGDKLAEFEKGDVVIVLKAPRLSPSVSLTYFQRSYLIIEPEGRLSKEFKELLREL